MRFTMPMLAAVLAAMLAFDTPKPLFAQSKELLALQTMQRDYYDLQRKIDELKTNQGAKAEELQTLVKQLMEANIKLSTDMRGVQDKITASQAEQATKVAGPISDLKRSIDDLSGVISGMLTNQNKMTKSAESTATTIDSVDRQLRLLQGSVDNLKPQAPVQTGPSPEQAAQLAFAKAESELLTGTPSFALTGFIDLASTYSGSPYAPLSWYKVGLIYADNEQYTDALNAFDRVLERSGDNPVRGQAQLHKAEMLEKLGRKDDAVREYEAVVRSFSGDLADEARAKIQELKTPPPTPAKPKQKSNAKKGR